MSIKDKVIIITGGTSGIGEASTRHFAKLGAKVVTSSIQQEEGEALEKELTADGHLVKFIYCNVSEDADVKNLVEQTLETYGRIDGTFANAGVWRQGNALDATSDDLNFMMSVNVMGPVLMAKHLVPVYEKQKSEKQKNEKQGGGVLLITTSVAAHVGFPAHVLYCASKAASESLVRTLAVDHAGIMRVAGICPGTIDTPMLAATCAGWDKTKDEIYADVRQKIPVRRMGESIDIANTAAFLLSDEASYINGTSIVLDGGTLALPPW